MAEAGVSAASEDWRTRSTSGWILLASAALTTGIIWFPASLRLNTEGDQGLMTVALAFSGLGYPIFGAWGSLLVGSAAAQMKLDKIWFLVALVAGVAGLSMCVIALSFAGLNAGGFSHIGPVLFVFSVLAGLPPIAAGWAAAAFGQYLRGRSAEALSSATAGAWTALASMPVAAAITFGVATTLSNAAFDRQIEARNAAVHVISDDTAVGYYRYLSEHPSGPGSAIIEQRLYDLDPAFRETARGRAISALREASQ